MQIFMERYCILLKSLGTNMHSRNLLVAPMGKDFYHLHFMARQMSLALLHNHIAERGHLHQQGCVQFETDLQKKKKGPCMNSTPVCYSLKYPSIFQTARCSLSKPLIKMNGLCDTMDMEGKGYFRVPMGVSNSLNKHLFSGIVIQMQRATAQCWQKKKKVAAPLKSCCWLGSVRKPLNVPKHHFPLCNQRTTEPCKYILSFYFSDHPCCPSIYLFLLI